MAWFQSLTTMDYVILGALGLAVLVGWMRGLVEVLVGFVVFLLATIVAGQYTEHVVAYLNSTWNLQDRMVIALGQKLTLPPEAYRTQLGKIAWQKALDLLQFLPAPESVRANLAHRISEWSASAGSQTAADYILQQLAHGILTAIVFAIFASLLAAALTLIGRMVSERINQAPLAGVTNSLLGAVAVGIEVAVFIALGVGLVAPVISMYGGRVLTQPLETARLTPYCLAFFEWLKTHIFGLTTGSIF